ncbi:uncharacterized protein LOC111991628 [Quercus suber]|uniref:uncharacterized protein LOC111991628 n=1 Tax=Quercus suber TaxID=58331 RepID=UPI0032DEED45
MDFERPIGRKAEKANQKRKDDGKDIVTKYLKKKKKILEEGCAVKKEKVEAHEPYFIQKRNAAKKLGLSPLQKMTTALRMLTYRVAADFMDEYVRIAESTAITSMKKFVAAVAAIFSEEYLRSPNNDFQAWWKVLIACIGNRKIVQLHGKRCIVVIFMSQSHVFSELAQGRALAVNYLINGHDYTMGYYLADGTYPQWSTFVKTIPRPLRVKRKLFAKAQEAYRKDVERAFGVLQTRFAIVRGPRWFFYHETLQDIMKACIILHNMIIEDEREEAEVVDLDYEQIDEMSCTPMPREPTNEFTEFTQVHQCIRDREVHSQLQMDLVKHLWQLQGES